MSTFTKLNNIKTTPLDGPNDLVETNSSFTRKLKADAKAAEAAKKSEKSE